MEKQEKSYSDWQDEGAHLNKEQWNKARELLTKGESGSEAIRMTENLVLPTNRKMYLSSKPGLYQLGWFNGERGKKDNINVSSQDDVLFDKGYNDCIENIKNLEEVA